MGHLTLDRLARLVDEEPTPEEREHLSSCLHCTAELGALRDQTEALADLPDLRPPQGDWDVLEARLVSEGIIERKSRFPFQGLSVTPGWVQAAAGLVLFAGGIGIGAARASSVKEEPAMTSLTELLPVSSVEPATLAQAEDAVRMAEQEYMEALVRYRQMQDDGQGGSDVADPAGRFAALDALVATTQAAVREAPADPFLNGVLVSAMAEREAVLRRVSGTPEWY